MFCLISMFSVCTCCFIMHSLMVWLKLHIVALNPALDVCLLLQVTGSESAGGAAGAAGKRSQDHSEGLEQLRGALCSALLRHTLMHMLFWYKGIM